MFPLPYPCYPRTKVERGFKYIYVLSAAALLWAMIQTMVDFFVRLENTFVDFAHNDNVELPPGMYEILKNCSAVRTVYLSGMGATSTMDVSTLEFSFLIITYVCIGIFIAFGMLLGTDALTKVMYAFNMRAIRIRGVTIRFNWIQPFWLFIYSVFVLSLIGASHAPRVWIQEYVDVCAERLLQMDEDRYMELEVDSRSVFGVDFTLMFVTIIVNVVIYFIAMFVSMYHGFKKENALLAKYDSPWDLKENICLGIPDKAYLHKWVQLRKQLGELLLDRRKGEELPEELVEEIQALELAVFLPSTCLDLVDLYVPGEHGEKRRRPSRVGVGIPPPKNNYLGSDWQNTNAEGEIGEEGYGLEDDGLFGEEGQEMLDGGENVNIEIGDGQDGDRHHHRRHGRKKRKKRKSHRNAEDLEEGDAMGIEEDV